MADSTDEDSPECHACGDTVVSSSDQRVITTLEDGEAQHLRFCSADCLENWES